MNKTRIVLGEYIREQLTLLDIAQNIKDEQNVHLSCGAMHRYILWLLQQRRRTDFFAPQKHDTAALRNMIRTDYVDPNGMDLVLSKEYAAKIAGRMKRVATDIVNQLKEYSDEPCFKNLKRIEMESIKEDPTVRLNFFWRES